MKAIAFVLSILFGFVLVTSYLGMDGLSMLVFGVATVLLFQGAFASYAMLYTFLEKKNRDRVRAPKLLFGQPVDTFSLIIPARHEERVIGDTLHAMANIDYPKDKYEVLVVVREDDKKTIKEVKKAIKKLGSSHSSTIGGVMASTSLQPATPEVSLLPDIRLITFDGYPINKPHALNVGLSHAKYNIVGIFDAEDEPHKTILSTIDTTFSHSSADVVQAAVQLVNVASHWYSALNSLEYYFWFKSVLPLFSGMGSTPLGGNTVFFKKSALRHASGWDEAILTEDADMGLRLSAAGFKIATVYEEKLATREETPADLSGFIRQRSRWNQGFLQVLFKGSWTKLPKARQQILTLYLLLQPVIHHFAILGFLFIPFFALGAHVPLWLSLYSFIPMYFFILQLMLALLGLADLGKRYKISFSPSLYFVLLGMYFPYQFVLSYASFRGFGRFLIGILHWEKTMHINVHRMALSRNKVTI